MRLSHRLFIFLIPVILLTGAWGIYSSWNNYGKALDSLARNAETTNLNELQLISEDPVLAYYFEDYSIGYNTDADHDLKDISTLFKATMDTAIKQQRKLSYIVLLSKDLAPLLSVTDSETKDIVPHTFKSEEELGEFNADTDYGIPFSKVMDNQQHIVIPIGIGSNQDDKKENNGIHGFIHATYILPLLNYQNLALSQLYVDVRTVGIQLLLLVIVLIILSRSLSVPFQKLVEQVQSISKGDPAQADAPVANIYELRILTNALNKMQTEILSQQEKLVLTKDKALASAEAKSRFLAIMSHELRTPLNSVLGMSQMLAKTPMDDRQTKYLGHIQNSGKMLLTIINDILDFSRIKDGKVDLEKIIFDITTILEEINGLFTARAEAKGLKFDINTLINTSTAVIGDPFRLRQVLFNLIDNAIKFTPSGAITLTAVIKHEDKESLRIKFSVQDDGIGISPAQKKSLFDAFTQADSSTARKFGGTGLGLAISSQIVSLMGGTFDLQSDPGLGSTFSFTITFVKSDVSAEKHLPELDKQISHTVTVDTAKHILLVEDNYINSMFLSELLSELGFNSIDLAHNGQQALSKLSESSYDLVFMDCQMPIMDGYKTTEEIRQREIMGTLEGHTPVIALTAHAMRGDRDKCINAGMDDYISKPIDEEILKNKLAFWLGHVHVPHDNIQETHVAAAQISDYLDHEALTKLRKRLGQKNGRNLVHNFLNNLPKDLMNLKSATTRDNVEEVLRNAHTLKGVFSIFNVRVLIDICTKIQDVLRKNPSDSIDTLTTELEEQSNRFCSVLRFELDTAENNIHS